MNISSQCIYLGKEWLLYAGPGGYELSEMLAPCIMFSRSGASIVCEAVGAPRVESNVILHAANTWSRAGADGLIIIYFDPISMPGRIINKRLSDTSILPVLETYPVKVKEAYDLLCSRNFTAEVTREFVESCILLFLGDEQLPDVDHRLLKVAELLGATSGGRLELAKLAEAVFVSPVHLRQMFKRQACTTLSKYKAWRQFINYLKCCESAEDSGGEISHSWRIGNTIRDAGYYDDAHGLRALSRYFGSRESLRQTPLLYLNCSDF